MPYYPTVQEVAERLRAALPKITTNYPKGIQAAKWKDPTLAKADNWKTGVQQAIANDAFRKGVQAADENEWRENAINAVTYLTSRLSQAIDTKWIQAWGPKYENVIRTVQALPPKSTDWRQNINNRLVPVVAAWKGERTGGR